MAFIVVDPDESSFLEPSYLDGEDHPRMINNLMRAPILQGGVQRNLVHDFDEASSSATSSTILLPQPTNKETVQVYLRVKPKTKEESEISSASSGGGSDNASSSAAAPASPDASGDPDDVVKIESDYQVAMNAPRESNTYKNSMNGAGQLVHRFAFCKIFSPEVGQEDLFREMVLPRIRDLMEGQNQLLFTYGATSSGKTYTIQGVSSDPGILPRALDVIFNSIGDRQMYGLHLKPNCFNRVVQMKEKDIRRLEEDKQGVFHLGLELDVQHNKKVPLGPDTSKISGISKLSEDTFNAADMTNLSQESLAAMFPDLGGRVREEAEIPLKHDDINYAVWISFAEIYNESIFDLLEKIPPVKRKGDKPKRNPLKLAEDKNGSIYIKGLKEIKVNSANEAYQVMMIGRENLHFAATRLNHHSSRSHCIFTIKVIRVAETAKPHLARVSMLSFCDLAGSERIKKTLNTGERQKEAGNINTSLLVLGRCMKAIRHNQITKDKKKHQLVPFRESKLTRMFQSFLVGYGKASMVVNVSQAPYLFDESVQVMKFAAITSKITVLQKPESPVTVVKQNKRKRQTRFSMMVVDHAAAAKNSTLMGRGSIAWENPTARSTMCFARDDRAGGGEYDDTIMEEEDGDVTSSVLDNTVVDQRYEGLLKLVDDLKNQLIKEKQDKITMEKEIRTELCDEFNAMLVEIETCWEKRLQDERERSEELSEWRLNKVKEANKAKRTRQNPDMDETAAFQQVEMELALEDKATELRCQEEKLAALQEQHAALGREKSRQAEELVKRTGELRREREEVERLRAGLAEAEKELEARKNSEESKSAGPIIEDLERQVQEQQAKAARLEEEKKGLKDLLDEAGEDFLEKRAELEKALLALREQEGQLLQGKVALQELTSQLEESRMLLQDSAARIEEKESAAGELEEQLEEARAAASSAGKDAEEKVAKLKAENEELKGRLEKIEGETVAAMERDLAEAKEGAEQARLKLKAEKERGERDLNDEIETLKAAKKKLKAQLETKEKAREELEREVGRLEGETKSLIQAEKQQRQAAEDGQAEVGMLRKQIKDINAKASKSAKVAELEAQLKQKDVEIEKLGIQVSSLQKEDRALEVVSGELQSRIREKEELAGQVGKLRSEVEAKEYDLSKMKEERDAMMSTYEQRLKKKTEELNVERREAIKMREVMSRSTPSKTGGGSGTKRSRRTEQLEEENKVLREELADKSEVIKKLESLIPSKKEFKYPSSEEDDDGEREEELKGQVVRLQREVDSLKTSHAKEMGKVIRANQEKTVKMYRETNLDLQRKVSASTASTTDQEVEAAAEADSNNENDADVIAETPGGGAASSKSRKRRRENNSSVDSSANNSASTTATSAPAGSSRAKRGRGRKAQTSRRTKVDSASQASFEDSNAENEDDDREQQQQPPPRRSSRIKRSRPVKKSYSSGGASSANSSATNDADHVSHRDSVLRAIQESPRPHTDEDDDGDCSSPTASAAKKTPATVVRKHRALYNSRGVEQFTPPGEEALSDAAARDTPRTVVKRQLRSKSTRKRN